MNVSSVPKFTLHRDDNKWSAIVETQGYYRANDRTIALALEMGKRGMIERWRDIYDGEWDQKEVMRFVRRLPEIVFAIMIADCTFTLSDDEDRSFRSASGPVAQ